LASNASSVERIRHFPVVTYRSKYVALLGSTIILIAKKSAISRIHPLKGMIFHNKFCLL